MLLTSADQINVQFSAVGAGMSWTTGSVRLIENIYRIKKTVFPDNQNTRPRLV